MIGGEIQMRVLVVTVVLAGVLGGGGLHRGWWRVESHSGDISFATHLSNPRVRRDASGQAGRQAQCRRRGGFRPLLLGCLQLQLRRVRLGAPRSLSEPACKFCASVGDELTQFAQTGARREGGQISVESMSVPPVEKPTRILVAAEIKQVAGTVIAKKTGKRDAGGGDS